MVLKRPATAAPEDHPKAKRSKKVEGLYARFKGKSIPEPRLARLKVKGKCCKAICWNVGGLRSVLEKRPQVFQKLVQSERPAVLAILEHRLQEGQHVQDATKKLSSLLPEYTAVKFACSKVKLGYSGVAMLIHKDFAPQAKMTAVKLEKGADEGRTMVVELPKLFVVACYVVNSGDGLKRLKDRLQHWDPKLRAYLQGLARKKPVLLLGDLNVAHGDADIWNLEAPHVPKSASTTPEERASFGKLLQAGFVDCFAQQHPEARGAFTYWSVRAGNRKPNRGLRLDYAVASAGMLSKAKSGAKVADAFHLPAYAPAGDHCPVGATVKLA